MLIDENRCVRHKNNQNYVGSKSIDKLIVIISQSKHFNLPAVTVVIFKVFLPYFYYFLFQCIKPQTAPL